jgi:anti-sigma factor RsiW
MPLHADVSDSCQLSDDDLERYLLGHVRDKAEVTRMEEHLLVCPACAERSEAIADYIRTMKEALRQFEREFAREARR